MQVQLSVRKVFANGITKVLPRILQNCCLLEILVLFLNGRRMFEAIYLS